jgi:hypothetical protein
MSNPIQNYQTIPINGSNIGSHSSMLNVLNTLIGSNHNFLNTNGIGTGMSFPGGPSMFSDVVVSTDESVLDSLKTIKLENKLDTACSICMGCLDKDEEAAELNCTHTFHTECIKPYLLNYNYRCPICRQEVGKPKYNI